MNKETLGGIFAALGISLFAAIALPLVNVFDKLMVGELMIIRGTVTCLGLIVLFPQTRRLPIQKIFWFCLLFGMANLSLFKGIRAWGANPTIVLVTTTPIVNVAAKWWRGERVDVRVLVRLVFLLVGVSIALNPWEATFSLEGLFWSLIAPIFVGVGYEYIGGAKDEDEYYKTMWVGAFMVGVGLVFTLAEFQIPFASQEWSRDYALKLLGYGFPGGFLYLICIVISFQKLKTEVASLLSMGETPAVIIGAYFTLGETLSWIQWGGVAIAMAALLGLSAAELKQDEEPST